MSTIIERFESKVAKSEDGCWMWMAGKNGFGYGYFKAAGRLVSAHRFAYELWKGEIPKGYHIDHLCRVPACVNPEHLEPVTVQQNTLRGIGPSAINARRTHCQRGHVFDLENTYFYSTRQRVCRRCRLLAKHRYRARLKAKGLPQL